ncbi:DNA repair protein RecO [Pinisolibacter aquiterrae]|uniref:DNA repair protein RecO n=1 Tax=Pinisolibacter aquiterrae TaxID=2815579 RepID=UPI001C3C32A0|nr:DNA repair protein RecO [Pinisolibacter aquiterrae]MBV5264160.1 DNA repair protein RecO [Pinisolibacter aquiterrae]MCC8233746.1 DNA repair protein RecO [Pinisolibacter aquiterrae]
MEWSDVGVVLGTRRLGEADALVELMTRDHGRHLGAVKGGRSKSRVAMLQIGNRLDVVWRARLDEHMGSYVVEPADARAAALMADPLALNGIQTLAAHLRLLPERDPHPDLFADLELLLDRFDHPRLVGELMVRFELAVIEALGFGLDLSECALTGEGADTADLAWVSPKTGRAAGRAAGAPWADRLLPLPRFLAAVEAPAGWGRVATPELRAGLDLTRHFFQRHVWEARGIVPPATRDGFLAALARALEAEDRDAR